MRRSWLGLVLVLVACGPSTPPVGPTPEPGPGPSPGPGPVATHPDDMVAPPPADPVRLGSTLRVLAYAPDLTIDPNKSEFTGAIAIDVELPAPTSEIVLHGQLLTVQDATITPAAGAAIALTAVASGTSRIRFTAGSQLPAGRARIAIRYTGHLDDTDTEGVFRQQAAGQWYAFTQFEAIAARRAFPCIDEPDVKVPWTVTLRVPAGMTAVGNTPVAKDTTSGDTRTLELAPTQPLPSYLVAFGVGPFDIVDAGKTRSGTPIRIIALAGRAADAKVAAEITPKVIAGLEDWFGMPFPYSKIDAMAIPITVGFGAMENAGIITYRADLVLMKDDAPVTRKRRYAGYASHELAHQWFGDLVTPVWWDDLWLNESFASWLPVHIFETVFPEWLAPATEVNSRARALGQDSLVSARRVRQPIETEDDIVTAFDGITYQKGAAVLHMFEEWAGEAKFQQGVRDYLTAHANGNATAKDFMAAVSASTGVDITTAMSTLLDQAGVPKLDVGLTCTGGHAVFSVTQSRYLPIGSTTADATPTWQLPVCVVYGDGKTRHQTCSLVTKATSTIEADGCTADSWFYANAGGRGYYYTAIADQLKAIEKVGWKRLDADERLAFAQDVVAAVGSGEVDMAAALDLVPLLVADGGRYTVALAAGIIEGVRRFLPVGDPAVARWVRKQFGPLAKKIGWKAKKSDTPDVIELRELVVPLVAELGADKTLRTQAVALARDWRKLPPGDSRGDLLRVAARAKPALVAAWRDDFKASTDRVEHKDLAVALGRVDVRAEVEASLALLLDPAVDVREADLILDEAHQDPVTVTWAEDWTVAHLDELIARYPTEGAASLVHAITSSCDADRIEPMRAVADAKIVPLLGGPRTVTQAFEGLSQCVAKRHAIEPALEAWRKALK